MSMEDYSIELLSYSDLLEMSRDVVVIVETETYQERTTVGRLLNDIENDRFTAEFFDEHLYCYEESQVTKEA